MSVDVVVFVVHGQSLDLDDCINPYVDNFILNGHKPELLVLDSTAIPAEANAAKESLSRVCRKYKLDGLFASAREHKRYLRDTDLSALEYAVGDGTPGVGAMVNMGLLATSGKSALFIDADTRFEVSSSSSLLNPPIVRKFNLIDKMPSETSRMGTWGSSCTTQGGCFYRGRHSSLPPFIPDSGWLQGVPWFLMSRCSPSSLPVDLPWAIRKLSPSIGLSSSYTPLFDLIHGLVEPGSLAQAAEKLTDHLSEFDFNDKLVKYVNLLSSWGEVVDRSATLFERGVKLGYKP